MPCSFLQRAFCMQIVHFVVYNPFQYRTCLLQVHKQNGCIHCVLNQKFKLRFYYLEGQVKCPRFCWIRVWYHILSVYGTKPRICDLFLQLLYEANIQETPDSPHPNNIFFLQLFFLFLICLFLFSFCAIVQLLVTVFFVFFVTHLIALSPLCYLFIVAHTILCQLSFPLCPYNPSLFSWFSQPLINIPCSLPVSERMNEKEVGTEREREMQSEGEGREEEQVVSMFLEHCGHCFLDWGPRVLLSHLSQ